MHCKVTHALWKIFKGPQVDSMSSPSENVGAFGILALLIQRWRGTTFRGPPLPEQAPVDVPIAVAHAHNYSPPAEVADSIHPPQAAEAL